MGKKSSSEDKHQELEKLFGTLKRGLSVYSVSELNQKISEAVDKTDESSVDYLFELICCEYKTNKIAITEGNSDELREARYLCWAILHKTLGFSLRKIAIMFQKKNHNSITSGVFYITNIKENTNNEKLKKLKIRFKTFSSMVVANKKIKTN